jgi:hypothetical protein
VPTAYAFFCHGEKVQAYSHSHGDKRNDDVLRGKTSSFQVPPDLKHLVEFGDCDCPEIAAEHQSAEGFAVSVWTPPGAY